MKPTGAQRDVRHALVVAVLLVAHAALAVGATLSMSATCDEVAHLTAGYSYWRTGDFGLVPEHPPLAELWAASPLVLVNPDFPSLDQESWWRSDQWTLGPEFLYRLGNDADALLLYGRCMIALLSMALGVIVYVWARRLFGPMAGIVALGLYALSPTMLAHAALVTTDLVTALFFVLSVAALWSVLHRVSAARVLGSALVVAGLVLSKMSAVLLVPIAAGLVLVRLIVRRPLVVALGRTSEIHSRAGQLGVIAAVALIHLLVVYGSIWSIYGLRYDAFSEPRPAYNRFDTVGTASPYETSWDHELGNVGRPEPILRWARDHRVLPESFLYGLAYTVNSTRTRAAFLNGERSPHGFRRFFPYAFLVKTPLPLFGVIVLAVAAGLARRAPDDLPRDGRSMSDAFYDAAPLWILLLGYWGFAITSHLNIGHRHLLPVYPPVFILCGSAAVLWTRRRRVVRWSLPAMLTLYALSSLSVWPHCLAFFNTLAGGPKNGYRHLIDSSLDWGQDLKRLAKWTADSGLSIANARHGEGGQFAIDKPQSAIYLSYAGNALPSYYGIEAEMLPSHPPWDDLQLAPLREGVYCISATMLQQVYLLPSSRWTPSLERVYQMYLPRIRAIQETDDSGDGRLPDAELAGRALSDDPTRVGRSPTYQLNDKLLLKLRFGRLCAALRQREPDDRAGHSILIYKLSDEQIEEALFGPPAELVADTAEGLCELALELSKAGEGEPALDFIQEAASMAPDDAYIRHWLAFALHRNGRTQEAFEQYRRTLQLDPRYPGAHTNLGLILAGEGRLPEAVEMYRRALQIQPRKPQAHANLALALAAMGQATEAIASARKAVALRPRDPTLQLCLARVLVRLDRRDEAIAAVARALERAHALRDTDAAAPLAKRLDELRAAKRGHGS